MGQEDGMGDALKIHIADSRQVQRVVNKETGAILRYQIRTGSSNIMNLTPEQMNDFLVQEDVNRP